MKLFCFFIVNINKNQVNNELSKHHASQGLRYES